MLSTAAFNALLKSLEEPPANTVFIFATTEPHKIPETVISRCQRHDFRRLTTPVIAEELGRIVESEGFSVGQEILEFIARKANGGMRDSLSMLDRLLSLAGGDTDLTAAQQLFGVVDRTLLAELATAVLSQKPSKCFSLLDQVFEQSIDLRTFAGDFLEYWRNALLLGISLESDKEPSVKLLSRLLALSASEIEELQKQTESTSSFDLQRLFEIAEDTVDRALKSNFPRFVVEAGVAKMASLPSLRPLPEILTRLEGAAGTSSSTTAPPRPAAASAEARPAPVAAKPEPVVELTEEDEGKAFDPSWQAFVQHVKSRSEVILAAFLRRVSATNFHLGALTIEASSFDLESLKDPKTFQSLRECLHSYSGHANWDVKLVEGKSNGATTVDGSIAAREVQARKKRSIEIDREARSQDVVKDALSTFQGSSIERVSILKP